MQEERQPTALARRFVHLAFDAVKAHAYALLALRLAYLLELADLILSDLDSVERLRRAAALAAILDALEFDLYFDWLLTYPRGGSELHTALASTMGAFFKEFTKLADSAEREGRREMAESYRLCAQAAYATGRALELYHEIARAAWQGAHTHAASLIPWVDWDREAYKMLADGEWYAGARREILGAALGEILGRAPPGSAREALRRRAAELAEHIERPSFPTPEAEQRARRRYRALPKDAFNPFLRAREEAVGALEELRELNLLERLSEAVERMERVAEELERRLLRLGG